MSKNYDVLIGYSSKESKELHSIKEVAEFICEEGMRNDLLITEPDGTFFLDTFGIYINKIEDMEYRTELLKVLIPMQGKLERGESIYELDEEDGKRIEDKIEEYLKHYLTVNPELDYVCIQRCFPNLLFRLLF